MKTKGSRFLIDTIDRKLGSVEKELKFDKIAIFSGLGITAISAFVLGISIKSHPFLAILSVMFMMLGVFVTYYMIKEYFDDLRKVEK